MTRKFQALPLSLALLLGTAAHAQSQFEGLDLTDEPKKEEKKPADAPPPEPPPEPVKRPLTAKEKEEGPAVERDVTQEDRVKSVQRKLYIKRGRFELAPSVFTNVNDPYYTKVGASLRGAFYVADTLAIAARFSLMQVLPTDDVRAAKRSFQSRIFFSVPMWSAMADVEWSAFYGKAAFFNSILHFDAYVLAGAGVVNAETSSQPDRGLYPAADLGLGFRFIAKDFLAFNASLINTSYVDIPAATTKAAAQNVMVLNLGVSIFFPFKSTYREAE